MEVVARLDDAQLTNKGRSHGREIGAAMSAAPFLPSRQGNPVTLSYGFVGILRQIAQEIEELLRLPDEKPHGR